MRAVVLLALAVAPAALAMISCLSVEEKGQIRGMPRFAWVLAILLLPLVGPLLWFLFGRPTPLSGVLARWWQGAESTGRTRPAAPDDDPEFLRSLAQQTRPGQPPSGGRGTTEAGRTRGSDPDAVDGGTLSEEDEHLLQQWEQDLQRREDASHSTADSDQVQPPHASRTGPEHGGEGDHRGNSSDDRPDEEQPRDRGDSDSDPHDEGSSGEERRRDSGSES